MFVKKTEDIAHIIYPVLTRDVSSEQFYTDSIHYTLIRTLHILRGQSQK